MGVFFVTGAFWLLIRSLGAHRTLYAGKSMDGCAVQIQALNGPETGLRNTAIVALGRIHGDPS